MQSKRKFYKTELKVIIVSEDPVPEDMSLSEIGHEGERGDYVVNSNRIASGNEQIDAKQAARVLLDTGSEPEFFNLTEDGEDLDG